MIIVLIDDVDAAVDADADAVSDCEASDQQGIEQVPTVEVEVS